MNVRNSCKINLQEFFKANHSVIKRWNSSQIVYTYLHSTAYQTQCKKKTSSIKQKKKKMRFNRSINIKKPQSSYLFLIFLNTITRFFIHSIKDFHNSTSVHTSDRVWCSYYDIFKCISLQRAMKKKKQKKILN